MAYFAQIDDNNIVIQVIRVNDSDCQNSNGFEDENVGIDFCKSLIGQETNWKQTSYNAKIRKHFAGIGYIYDEENDAFYAPQPYPSWILNETTFIWEAPIAVPTDNKIYEWNEANEEWDEVEQ
jgi:hypothetical protein